MYEMLYSSEYYNVYGIESRTLNPEIKKHESKGQKMAKSEKFVELPNGKFIPCDIVKFFRTDTFFPEKDAAEGVLPSEEWLMENGYK